MNRRGNGLSADSYAPLVDLAPHLADEMLTALREAGVAAYAATPGELAGLAEEAAAQAVTEGVRDVLDRLYVDVDMKSKAERILRIHLTRLREGGLEAGLPDATEAAADSAPPTTSGGVDLDKAEPADERDEDEIWAEIVAGFDAVPEGDRNPWPDQENLDEPETPPEEGDDRTGRLPRARVIKTADVSHADASDDDEDLAEEEEGHYVPPPPPPLPSADPLTKGAWVALVGGPLYLLVTVILDWEVPGYAAFLAVAAFIGGFVTLVLRMGDEPRDPDDGAVV